MRALRFDDLRQHTDVLRLRNGQSLTVRFVEPQDAEMLQNYFRSLSVGSRYNRFLGAMASSRKPNSVISFMPARMIVSASSL